MKIAVCDDDKKFCEQVRGFLQEVDCIVSTFYDGEALVSMYTDSNHPFEMIFLDMEMPLLNGLSTAEEIRRIDPSVLIIYITRYSQYALAAYDTHPFHYLLKPLEKQEFLRVFNNAAKELEQTTSAPKLLICTREKRFFLPLDQVVYIERVQRKVAVHTEQEVYEYYDSLTNLENRLGSHGFLRIFDSILVNLDKIAYFHRSNLTVTMTSGSALPVSRRRWRKIDDYLKQEGAFLLGYH